MFNIFNIKSKKSWNSNYNSGKIKNSSNINGDKSSSFSFKNNIIFNKSTTTSRTDNLISTRSFHNQDDENNDTNNCKNIGDDCISNNSNIHSHHESKDNSSYNLINLNTIKINISNNNNDSIINKPIIKEKNNTKSAYSINVFHPGKMSQKKFFSPDQNSNKKKIIIPHLNFGPIQNNLNNNLFRKINSFRESIINNINNNSSSIKSIYIHYNEEEYDECYDFNVNNDNYINYNIIYTIKCNDNKTITCEYNYEKDSVDIIIKNLDKI